jgi:hypothetical protein
MSVAKPVHAIPAPASPALMVKTCRALKVLHGWGITWHTVGDRVIFYTAGDICGCHACATYLNGLLEGVHPRDPLQAYYDDPQGQALVQAIHDRKAARDA